MRRYVALLTLGLTTLGCARRSPDSLGAATTTTTMADYQIRRDKTIELITRARCEHELACNNIGVTARYPTVSACSLELGADTRGTLRTSWCPAGLDAPDVSACLTDIRNARCGRAIDSLAEFPSCAREKICR
jgi:hypothetical protein